PLAGALSDRIGRRPLLLFFGVAGSASTVSLMMLLADTRSAVQAFLIMMGSLVIVTGYTSINAVVKAELFPTNVRAMGVGLPYALTVAIFGGTAEYIALWLKQAGHEQVFFYYVSTCILISLFVYVFMPETTKKSTLDG
ncbi:MAG TPA: MFS transporter, partial [Kutzneria sp.]|nr:MFS transporter [Kutzneria sp.]